MAELEGLTDQGTPLLDDLGAAAPALGRLIEAQGTLADASRESFPSLGDALERGRPALIRARPLIRDLGRLGQSARPDLGRPRRAHAEPRRDRRRRAHQRLPLLRRAVHQRLRLARPLPARRARDQHLHRVRRGCRPGSPAAPTSPRRRAVGGTTQRLLASLNAPEPKGEPGGSVPPTGTLLEDLLADGADPALRRQREASLERLRRQARGGSPASVPRSRCSTTCSGVRPNEPRRGGAPP